MLTVIFLTAAMLSAVAIPFVDLGNTGRPPDISSQLFFPANFPEGNWEPTDLEFVDCYFENENGIKLHGWFCESAGPQFHILYLHGNAGNVATRVDLLKHVQLTTRSSIFIFDYQGYGRSEGQPSVEGLISDAQAARTAFGELQSISDSEMVLLGESIGGAIAIQLAADSSPRALILQSTFSSLRDLADLHFRKYASLVPSDMLNSEALIKSIHTPLFQSHGELDSVVPIELAKKLYQAANHPKQFIELEGADHNGTDTPEYWTKLDGFMQFLTNDQK